MSYKCAMISDWKETERSIVKIDDEKYCLLVFYSSESTGLNKRLKRIIDKEEVKEWMMKTNDNHK